VGLIFQGDIRLRRGRIGFAGSLRMCSVLEPGGRNGMVPFLWNGFDPVFGSEKFEERNGSIPVFGFGMG
jgi:hypothetical protein